jgi:hypothetical protein
MWGRAAALEDNRKGHGASPDKGWLSASRGRCNGPPRAACSPRLGWKAGGLSLPAPFEDPRNEAISGEEGGSSPRGAPEGRLKKIGQRSFGAASPRIKSEGIPLMTRADAAARGTRLSSSLPLMGRVARMNPDFFRGNPAGWDDGAVWLAPTPASPTALPVLPTQGGMTCARRNDGWRRREEKKGNSRSDRSYL